MIRSLRSRSKSGMTIIELSVSSTIMSLVMIGSVMALQRGLDMSHESTANSQLNSRATRALTHVTSELMGAAVIAPNPVAPFGSSTLNFRNGVGWAGGNPIWGTPRRLGFELAAGELDNGIDDNEDGLIDEGSLVLTEDPGAADEIRTVLVTGISEFLDGETPNGADDNGNGLRDENGLSFEMVGDNLIIRMTLARMGAGDVLTTRTHTSSIVLRN